MKVNSPHEKFISSSIIDVLKDGLSAYRLVGSGIETYPVSDYVMQSIFLRMTGYQEQKLKCICWALATYDYEYRYDRYYRKWSLGQCSSLREKTAVFKDLLDAVKKYDENFDCEILKTDILKKVKTLDKDVFQDSSIIYFNEHLYQIFKQSMNLFEKTKFLKIDKNKNVSFLEEKLRKLYENYLFRQRNRCAHNLLSYQQNLPDLKDLKADTNNFYGNYFLFFALLVLIDGVFTSLYEKYCKLRETSCFD